MIKKIISKEILDSFFKTSDVEIYFHNWIKVSSHDFDVFLSEHNALNMTCFKEQRNQVINFLIAQINISSFGAGSLYEVYSERLSSEIRSLCSLGIFSEAEEAIIKGHYAYFEVCEQSINFCSCEGCDCGVSCEEDAESTFIAGSSLCSSCLYDAIIG